MIVFVQIAWLKTYLETNCSYNILYHLNSYAIMIFVQENTEYINNIRSLTKLIPKHEILHITFECNFKSYKYFIDI